VVVVATVSLKLFGPVTLTAAAVPAGAPATVTVRMALDTVYAIEASTGTFDFGMATVWGGVMDE
jgi:hypothetical protein